MSYGANNINREIVKQDNQRDITKKLIKGEQSVFYLDLIHKPIKLHEDIPNSYRVIGCGVQDYWENVKKSKGHSLETKKVGTIILVRGTLSLPKLRSEIVWHRFFAAPAFICHFRSHIAMRKLLV